MEKKRRSENTARSSSLLLPLHLGALALLLLTTMAPLSAEVITEDTTWYTTGTIVMATTVTVAGGATLSIEPGVEVRVADGGVIRVSSGGNLVTQGTLDLPVLFTHDSDTPTSGGWQGVYVAPGGAAELVHTIVEYGNANNQSSAVDYRNGGIVTVASPDVVLEDCLLRHGVQDGFVITDGNSTQAIDVELQNVEIMDCPRYGIEIRAQQNASMPRFEGLNIHGCGDAAINVTNLGDTPVIGDATLTGNGFDGVRVYPGWDAPRDVTISGAVPWRMHQLRAAAGTTVRVEDGAQIQFTPTGGLGLQVPTGGALIVEGTASDPVVFTSGQESPAAGDWPIIQFSGGSTVRLDHCRLEYSKGIQCQTQDAELRNTVISDCPDGGFYYAPDSSYAYARPLLLNTTFANCGDYPIHAPYFFSDLPLMDGLVLTGNNPDKIMLDGGYSPNFPPGTEVTIPDPGYPIVIMWGYVSRGLTANIEAGVHFESGQGTGITVQGSSTGGEALLRLRGTADNPIRFTDSRGTPGQALYLTVNGSGGFLGRVDMEHCTFDGGNYDAAVSVAAGGSLTARDCTFNGNQDGKGVGVSNADARFTRCSFTNNANYGLELGGYEHTVVLEECLISGNGQDGIYTIGPRVITGCDITNNAGAGISTWYALGTSTVPPPVLVANRISGNGTFGVENTARAVGAEVPGKVIARNHWWGDPTGPYHATLNPGGLGDPVSDNITFVPWATSPDLAGSSDQMPISLDQPTTGTVSGTRIYALVFNGDEAPNVLARLNPTGGAGTWKLTERDGELPTAGLYDRTGTARNGGHEILIPSPGPGIYYFAVTYNDPAGEAGSYEFEIRSTWRAFTGMETASAGNGGLFTQRLDGAGFESGMTVELRSPAGGSLRTFTPSDVTPTELVVPMDLSGLPVGMTDVAAVWPDTDELVLQDSFEVEAGQGGEFWASFNRRFDIGVYRPFRVQMLDVYYGNRGDADVPSRLLVLNFPDQIMARASLEDEGDPESLQIFTLGPPSSPGKLPPGFQGHVVVYYTVSSEMGAFTFNLEEKAPDDTVIDWDSQKDTLRPADIDTATWDSSWPAIKAALGGTTVEHLNALAGAAERLVLMGSASTNPGWSVSHLVDLLVHEAAGAAHAAVSGRLTLLPWGRPQPTAAVKLYDIAAPDTNPRTVRTNNSGDFYFANIADGTYEIFVNEYFLDQKWIVTVASQQDVLGLDIPIYEDNPNPIGPDGVLLGHSPSLVSGAGGSVYMTWENSGELWSLAWTDNAWQGSTAIAAETGANPDVVYDPDLFGAGEPGLLAAWEIMDANQVNTLAWSAGKYTGSAFEWTIPVALTSDANDDLSPQIVRAQDGSWMVIWMQRANGAADDTDLYLTTLDPATAGAWYVPPVPKADRSLAVCDSFNFATKIEIPNKLQEVFGKSYEAEVGWELCEDTVSCGEYKKSGGANLSITLGDSLTGTVAGQMQSSYRLSCKPCRYMPWTMRLNASGGLEANFARPVPVIVAGIPVGTAKFSLPVALQVKGSLGWQRDFMGWPDSGFVGIDCVGGGRVVIEDHLGFSKGQGDLNITGSYQWNPNEGFKVDGACITLSGEASIGAGFLKRKISKQWGEACRRGEVRLGDERWITNDTIHISRTSIDGDILVSESMEVIVSPLTGTGGVYEGSPVLSTVPSDLYDDGAPAVVRNASANEVYLVWTKDTGDYNNGLGNQVVFSVDDGTGWSAPEAVQAQRHFNRDCAATLDPNDDLFAVWSQGSAAGLTSGSSVSEVDAAVQACDIVFARRVAGAWEDPSPIASPGGRNDQPCVLRLGSRILVTWVQTLSDTEARVLSSSWDGARWTAPAIVSSSGWCNAPAIASLGSTALLVWSEDEDADLETTADTRLRYATAGSNGVWTSAAFIPASLTSDVQNTENVARATTRADIMRFNRAIPRPDSSCCGDNCKPSYKKPRPRKPPQPLNERDNYSLNEFVSKDPNEKHSPLGWGVSHVVDRGDEVIYTILFENKAEAAAPAQDVFVIDDVSESLDWTTFEIRSLGWGSEQMAFEDAPAAIDEYITIADYRAEVGADWLLNINGSIDETTGRVSFTFRTLDPITEEPPLDPEAGFLPPNDETHRGEGFLVFAMKPKPDLAEDLTVTISNVATIIFDFEDPIVTNQVDNPVGDVPELWAAILTRLVGSEESTEPIDVNGDGAFDVGDLLAP
ncbi:right-handed parallel beta-helix repeat-containing protein [bacterium]|nr:right-handed parallel beta-helix repeat-containing protein [bacterium]